MKLRIKEIAIIKGVTQSELAKRMGVSLSMVKNLYASESHTTKTLEKVAEALDCEVWEFFISAEEIKKGRRIQ